MIIGIDGSSILPQRTGVGNYTFHLLRELAALAPGEERFRIFLNSLRHPFPKDAAFLRNPRFEVRRWRLPGPWLVNAWRCWSKPPIEWFVGQCDVFHSASTYIPPQRHGARVTTIYDLFFLRHPEQCHRLGGQYYAEYLPRVAPSLDRIIAISRSTAADVAELLSIGPDRVRVVYGGVDERFKPVTDPEALAETRRRHGLPSEFLLTVATLEPRKNLPRLLQAYRLLRGMGQEPPPLVLVGASGWKNSELRQTIAQLGLGNRLVFPGYVPDGDLPAIYSMASVFALPSLYEGFGLPLLEAMACSTPTVASATSSLGEVAGGASLTVEPTDVEAIAHAMKEALENETTRARLKRAGLERARQFTWRRCAEETLAVYREAAKR